MSRARKQVTLDDMEDLHHMGVRLGRGAFAQVKLIKHKKTDIMLALKVIDLINSGNFSEEMKQIMTECRVHKDLNHPNIIE